MDKHHEKILEIMIEVDKICRKNNIKYYMLGGTMLGAYRHKGFIPWDDDADIGIFNDDYELFLKKAEIELKENFIVRNIKKENVPYSFTHIENKNTTCIEQNRSATGYSGGVYIEIFPLHGCSENIFLREYLYMKIKFLKKILFTLILDINSKRRGVIKSFIIKINRKIFKSETIIRQIINTLNKNKISKSKYICNLLGHWERKETFYKNIFGNGKEYEFEGYKFYGVEKPEEYLKQMYGKDFMLPPSEEKIKLMKHPHLILNLDIPYNKYKKDKNV